MPPHARPTAGIDAVVLTATVMSYGRIEDTPPDVFTTVVDTAVHGTLHVAQAVMPVLREQHAGVFIVVNSLLGSVTVPQMGAYATAKWGQRALVRTLQQETRGDKDIHVCLVSPGSTNTPIYYQAANYTGRGARPPVPVQQPERTAAAIAGLIDRPRPHVSIPVGPPNPLIISGFRLAPWVYDRAVGPLFKLAALTRTPVAATTGNVASPVAGEERVRGRWPYTSRRPLANAHERMPMLAFILLLIIIWIIAGIIGVAVHGLIWLTIIAAVLFLLTLFFGGTRLGSRRARR